MLMTLLSAIFGGALRLAPELLKFWGAKENNAHELAMQDKQLEFLKIQGAQKTDEIRATGDITLTQEQFKAFAEANASQAQMAVAGGKLAAAISSLVRPIVTFYIFILWGVHLAAVMVYSYRATGSAVETLVNAWTADDMAMLSMIASFWFVGRVMDKRGQ